MIWRAGFRTAVISPYEQIQLTEPRGPEAPDYIHPALDGGDGMHLNDKGAQAMANAVDPETLAL